MKWLRQHFVKREEEKGGEGSGGGAAPENQPPKTETPPQGTQPQETPPVEKAVPTVTYKSSAAQQLADMVTQAGMSPQEVLKAVQGNNGKATPEIYAALEAKHGSGMAALLSGQMTSLHEESVTKSKEADKAVFTQIEQEFKGITEQSGEDTWKELSTWAKENLEDDKVKEMNKLIKQGGMAAQLAIQELTNTFKQSGDFTQPAQLLEGDNNSNDTGAGGDLTRQEYREELQKLVDKGHQHGTSREIAALGRRREKSMRRGIR